METIPDEEKETVLIQDFLDDYRVYIFMFFYSSKNNEREHILESVGNCVSPWESVMDVEAMQKCLSF